MLTEFVFHFGMHGTNNMKKVKEFKFFGCGVSYRNMCDVYGKPRRC